METREQRKLRLEREARIHDIQTILDFVGSLAVVLVMFFAIVILPPIVELMF